MGEAASVGKERLPRITVVLILPDRILDVLPVERVLELGREDRDAVQEEREVETLLTLLAEAELAHDGEEVGCVEALQLLVEATRRPEICQPELAARILDAVSEHVERSPPLDLAREPAEEARLHVARVVLLEPLPLSRLGSQEEVDDVGWDQAEATVVVLRRAPVVAARHQPIAVPGRQLERSIYRHRHQGRSAVVCTRSLPRMRALRSLESRRFLTDVDLASDRRRDQRGAELLKKVDGLADLGDERVDFRRLVVEESGNLVLFDGRCGRQHGEILEPLIAQDATGWGESHSTCSEIDTGQELAAQEVMT